MVKSESGWDWPGMEAVSEVGGMPLGRIACPNTEFSSFPAALCALQAKKAENANVHPETKKMDALVP